MANKWEEIYSSDTLDCSQLACIFPGEKPGELIYLLNEYSLMEEIDWDGFSQVTGQMVFWLKVLSRPVGEQWRKAKYAFVTEYMAAKNKSIETNQNINSKKVDSQPCDSAGTLNECTPELIPLAPKSIIESTIPEHPDSSIKLPGEDFEPYTSDLLFADPGLSYPPLKANRKEIGSQSRSQASFTCDHCSYSTQYQSRMRSHLRSMHSDSKPFACTMCDHKTTLFSSLKKHMNSVHQKSKPHKCPHCPYTAAMKQYLTIHIRGVHEKNYKHQCPHCGYASVSKNVVRIHINAVHEKTKPHKCPFCDYTSSYPTYIPKHIDAVHKNLRPFACPNCDYKSSTKIYLQKHIDAVHSNIRPHSCPHCPFTTSYNQYLNKHIRAVHLDEKPYKCSYCPFRCAYKSYITKHIQLVHATQEGNFLAEKTTADVGEEVDLKPLIDELPEELLMNNNAGEKTPYNQYLNKHIGAAHLDEEPYKCSYCPFKCAYKSSITKHIQAAHATEDGNLPSEKTSATVEEGVEQPLEAKLKPLIDKLPGELSMNNLAEEKTPVEIKEEEAGCSSRTNDCVFPGMDLHNNMFL